MARVIALMAVLAVFVVAATATRSTITTVEIEDDNQMYGGAGRCMQQMQMAGGLDNCRMFMMDLPGHYGGQPRGRCQFGQCDIDDDDNQYGTGSIRGGGMSVHFQPCCDQLRQMDQQCRCEGLKQMIMGQGREQMQEMGMIARDLPQMCGMGPQHCDMMRGRFDF